MDVRSIQGPPRRAQGALGVSQRSRKPAGCAPSGQARWDGYRNVRAEMNPWVNRNERDPELKLAEEMIVLPQPPFVRITVNYWGLLGFSRNADRSAGTTGKAADHDYEGKREVASVVVRIELFSPPFDGGGTIDYPRELGRTAEGRKIVGLDLQCAQLAGLNLGQSGQRQI